MFKATIYTLLATCFLAITLGMVIGGFNHPGFNTSVMVSISGAMTLIMSVSSWVLWKNSASRNIAEEPIKPKATGAARFGKVVFASYAVALGASIFGVVAGIWLFGFEQIDSYIKNYMGSTLLAITIISVPMVNRYLR